MTDSEREEYYLRKKKEILDKILGPESPYSISDSVTVRFTSPLGKGDSWRTDPRGLMSGPEYDLAMKDLAEYNRLKHECNGKIVTYVDTPLEKAVGDPIK